MHLPNRRSGRGRWVYGARWRVHLALGPVMGGALRECGLAFDFLDQRADWDCGCDVRGAVCAGIEGRAGAGFRSNGTGAGVDWAGDVNVGGD